MKKKSDLLKIAVAIFLIAGGLIFLMDVPTAFEDYYPSALYSVVASVAILLFTIGSGAYYLASPNKAAGERLMLISLFIQAFPFSIFGITCINFFGAFIGAELMIAPAINVGFQLRLFTGVIRNIFQLSGEIFYFGVNIFPLFLIWLMRYLTREEKRAAEVSAVLQNMDNHTSVDREQPR